MNAMRIPVTPEAMLNSDDATSVRLLQAEINVLREARECVTDTATPGVIYGRVDDLINRRQDQLIGIYQRARGVDLAEVHNRG